MASNYTKTNIPLADSFPTDVLFFAYENRIDQLISADKHAYSFLMIPKLRNTVCQKKNNSLLLLIKAAKS